MKGDKIFLRALQLTDVQGMLEWMNDNDINRFFRFDADRMTKEKAVQFVNDSIRNMEEKSSYNFAITDDKNQYLGTISLKDIDWDAKAAEYAISLRKSAQGKGIAIEATKKLFKIAFEELKLNRIFLNVLSENKRAIHMYEKCGFVYEGEFRQHILMKGELRDLKWYSILKTEYESNAGEGYLNRTAKFPRQQLSFMSNTSLMEVV